MTTAEMNRMLAPENLFRLERDEQKLALALAWEAGWPKTAITRQTRLSRMTVHRWIKEATGGR